MRIDQKDQRVYIKTSLIKEGTRVRQDYGDLEELAESIKNDGCIHPPTIDLNYNLIAGGRRFRAMRDVLQLVELPVTFIECADEAALRRLEAEENVRRKEITWQERVRSIKLIHSQKSFTAAIASDQWTQKETGALLNMSQANVAIALNLANLIISNDPDIIAASTISDAIRILLKRREDEVNKLVVSDTIPKQARTSQDIMTELLTQKSNGTFYTSVSPAPQVNTGFNQRPETPEVPNGVLKPETITIPLSSLLKHDSALNCEKIFGLEYFDHIVTDIPYGINMANLQQSNTGMDVSSTAAEHDVDENVSLMRKMFEPFASVLKPNGFLIMWCDISHWQLLYDLALQTGFKVQRWPLIWSKTHSCLNQSAQYNFTKNFEIAMVCRKGNATLLTPQSSSVWTGSGLAEKDQFGHPFAKPKSLWKWIYSAVAQRGQKVYDPFFGSGSSNVAAVELGLQAYGTELNEDHYNRGIVNVSNVYKALYPHVSFT